MNIMTRDPNNSKVIHNPINICASNSSTPKHESYNLHYYVYHINIDEGGQMFCLFTLIIKLFSSSGKSQNCLLLLSIFYCFGLLCQLFN